jgi:ribosomal protein S18 acetylase RimI-like enzyme
MHTPITYHTDERLSVEAYIDFLKRSDLGSMYPKQRFDERIGRLLQYATVMITARTAAGLLVGICLGLTDFAYFLYLTDIGVDRAYTRQGIGSRLLALAHEQAGGEDDICIITWSNKNATAFYEAYGMQPLTTARAKECTQWEAFSVV